MRMPDIIRIRGSRTGSPANAFAELSGGFQYAEEATPAEIVAVLHERIAAKSPAHARLVANYKRARKQARKRLLGGHVMETPRESRIRAYAEAIDSGMTKAQASVEVGVAVSTADDYAREIRQAAAQEAVQ